MTSCVAMDPTEIVCNDLSRVSNKFDLATDESCGFIASPRMRPLNTKKQVALFAYRLAGLSSLILAYSTIRPASATGQHLYFLFARHRPRPLKEPHAERALFLHAES
jgi:hypothetical protein